MTKEELDVIHRRALSTTASNEWDRCVHGHMSHECDACLGNDVSRLLAEVERLKALVERVEQVLRGVDANCDHTDNCDRSEKWARDDTPCTCVMRDVEAALEGD